MRTIEQRHPALFRQLREVIHVPVIKPSLQAGSSHRTGRLVNMGYADVKRALGFGPNAIDDGDKVTASWAFTVDGIYCEVWDYKGAWASTYGPDAALRKVFGSNYIAE